MVVWVVSFTIAYRNNTVKELCITYNGNEVFSEGSDQDIEMATQLPKFNDFLVSLGIYGVPNLPDDVLDYTFRFSAVTTDGRISVVGSNEDTTAIDADLSVLLSDEVFIQTFTRTPYSNTQNQILLGFRHLRYQYNGPCCTVSVLGNTFDVGFDYQDDADWAILLAKILSLGASFTDVLITTLYDQSGNGNHLSMLDLNHAPHLFSYNSLSGKVKCAAYFNYGGDPGGQGNRPDGIGEYLNNLNLPVPITTLCSFWVSGQLDTIILLEHYQHRMFSVAVDPSHDGLWRCACSPSGYDYPYNYFSVVGPRSPGVTTADTNIAIVPLPYTCHYRASEEYQEQWYEDYPTGDSDFYTMDTRPYHIIPNATQCSLGYMISIENAACWLGWVFEVCMILPVNDSLRENINTNVISSIMTPEADKIVPIMF